jgi:hypothetical protein
MKLYQSKPMLGSGYRLPNLFIYQNKRTADMHTEQQREYTREEIKGTNEIMEDDMSMSE